MGRLVLMLLLLASSVIVSPQSLQDVRIVTADDPPYVQTENGRLSGGLVVTRLYRVLDKLGIPRSRIQVLPWSRALQEARAKPGTLIFPIGRTAEREVLFDFPVKLADYPVYFFKLADGRDLRVGNMDAARLASVCVLANDYRQAFLQGAGFTRLELATDGTQNVNKFINGRCDLIASTEIGLYTKLQALGHSSASVQRLLPLVGLDGSLYAAFAKGTPAGLVEAFRQAAAD